MSAPARTAEGIVGELLRKAIPNGDCLECHLRPSIDSRGRERHFVSVGGRDGVKWRTSRLVYQIKKGPIPEYRIVMHTCDNLKCINPEHLVLGTHADNTQDMMEKGRHKYILPDLSKLTDAQMKVVKQLRDEGLSYAGIAEQFGVTATTIMNNLRNRDV